MASATESKTAIRRSNFCKIVEAFQDRNELLADALELGVPSLASIRDGQLEFNDQRFGHINPRLVAAGFPDGWLEQSTTELTAEMIQGLESQATDAYERELAEAEEMRAQAFVNPEVIAAQPAPAHAAAPALEEVESVVQADEPVHAVETTAQQDLWGAAELPPGQQDSPDTTGVMPTNKEPVMAKAKTTPPPAPRPRSAASTAKAVAPTPTRAGAVPLAAAVRAHPRGAPTAAKRAAAKSGQAPTTAKKRTATFASTQPAKKTGKVVAKAHVFVRGQDELTREQSSLRADALDTILENARRGAKVTLWRDLLGSSLPVWGNIRRGTILFRDELADSAEQFLHLPKGWLDNPTPHPKVAPWVTDESVALPAPLPAVVAAAQAKAAKKAGKAAGGVEIATPVVKTAPAAATKLVPVQGSLIGMPPPAPPRKVGIAMTTEEAHAAMVAAGVEDAAPAAQEPAAPVAAPVATPVAAPAAPVAAHVAAPAVVPAAPQGAGFIYAPPANPVPREPGFLTQAVGGVVLELAREGRFSDDDALRLINYLKGTH